MPCDELYFRGYVSYTPICSFWTSLPSHRYQSNISHLFRMYPSFPPNICTFLIASMQAFLFSEHMHSGIKTESSSQPCYSPLSWVPYSHALHAHDLMHNQAITISSIGSLFAITVTPRCNVCVITFGVLLTLHVHSLYQWDPGYHRLLPDLECPAFHTVFSLACAPIGCV
jgi:hypothetical protein